MSTEPPCRDGNVELGLPSWNDLAYHMFGLRPTDLPDIVPELAARSEVLRSPVFMRDGDIYFHDEWSHDTPPTQLPPWVEPKLREAWRVWNDRQCYQNAAVDPFGKLRSNIERYLSLFHCQRD